MKIILTAAILLSVAAGSSAQQKQTDEIQTTKGILNIDPVMHASLVLTWDGKAVYIDPTGNPEMYKPFAAPDLIVITDIHGDHLDLKAIEALNKQNALIVAPKAVADQLPAAMKDRIVVLNNGGQTLQSGIAIRAIPMYNLPEAADARHTKGRGNGYVMDFGGKQVYISGDTEDIPEMRSLRDIDVAFICMNLPYTMDVNQAASAVLEFKPAVVYPYHHRGQDINAFKKLVNDGDKGIDVRLRNWYP